MLSSVYHTDTIHSEYYKSHVIAHGHLRGLARTHIRWIPLFSRTRNVPVVPLQGLGT